MASLAPANAAAPETVAAPRLAGGTVLLTLLALVAETVLWVFAARGHVGLAAALVVHTAIVVAVTAALLAPRRAPGEAAAADKGHALLLLAATAAGGPLGPLAALAISGASRGAQQQPELLAAWYERIALASGIDPVDRQCDDVSLGRMPDLAAPPPSAFAVVMTSGQLTEKQNVLGHIARRFHPDYLGALTLALRSHEPVIRVQAAAVATRIRPQLRGRVDDIVLASHTADGSAARLRRSAEELRAMANSGLLDTVDVRRAMAAADRLVAQAARNVDDIPAVSLLRIASTRPVDDAFERLLLERGRFKELRQLRRVAALRRKGLFAVRYLRQRRVARARSHA